MTYGDHRLYLYEDNLELVVDAYGIYVDNRPMNNRKLATERLHDDYRKMYKHQFA